MKDAKGHGSDTRGGAAHQSMVSKILTAGDVHSALAHAVTGYDRQQEARASTKGTYYNPYALGHYLGAVDQTVSDIKAGKSHADAINNNFNGALARSLHKTLGTGGTDVDTPRRARFTRFT